MKARAISLWLATPALLATFSGAAKALQPARLLAEQTEQRAAQQSHQESGVSVPANSTSGDELPTGTTICVALAKTIDAKKAKPGDAIVARVTLPVLAKGKVFLPNDAKITGHVVSAKPRGEGQESEVAIVFDHAVMKDSSEVPLALTVQAIGRSAFTAAELEDQDGYGSGPFGAASRQNPSPSTHPTLPPRPTGEAPTPNTPDDSPNAPHPALDTGSHGAVGLPNLTLTEASDAATGSVVKATKKDVRLEYGMEMILRVVGSKRDNLPNQ
jgi:hypothetical protein